jgi:predicted RNase H-like HicB family nuclease
MERYIVIIEHQDLASGRLYGAFLPDMPGCTATGKTLEQTLMRVQSALVLAVRTMKERGECVPTPLSYEEHEREYRSAGASLGGMVVAAIPLSEEASVVGG